MFPSGPELLSDDSLAVSSPRLSPDQCRIVYLQYPSLVPHHQCSQLCLVSWRWARWGEQEEGLVEGSWSASAPHGSLSGPPALGAVMVCVLPVLLSRQGLEPERAGMGASALARLTAMRAFYVYKNAPPFASQLHMPGSARGWDIVGSYGVLVLAQEELWAFSESQRPFRTSGLDHQEGAPSCSP